MAESKQIGKKDGVAQLSSFSPLSGSDKHPQSYYDEIKKKFGEERDLRLKYRPEGTAQFNSNLEGSLEHFGEDSYARDVKPREVLNDTVEVLFIGGGFSALLTTSQITCRRIAMPRHQKFMHIARRLPKNMTSTIWPCFKPR